MRTIDTLKHICAWVACLGVMSPAATFGATPEVQVKQPASQVKDVELSVAGTLTGQVVDQQGNKLANVPVTFAQNGNQVAEAITNDAGEFSVSGLAGGAYQVASINGLTHYRAWSAETAPPAASQGILLVAPQSVVRGQCASGDCGGGYGQGIPQYSAQPMYGQQMQQMQPMQQQMQPMAGEVYGQPMGGEVVQAPMAEGAAVQGQPIYGPWVQGQPIPVGDPVMMGGAAPMAYGPPAAPISGGGGGFGFLANPWIIGGAVAAAIAIPLALDDNDDDYRPPSS